MINQNNNKNKIQIITKDQYNKWQHEYRNHVDTAFFAFSLFRKVFLTLTSLSFLHASPPSTTQHKLIKRNRNNKLTKAELQ